MNKLSKEEIISFLNYKSNQYNNIKFIETDPIQIPHLFNKKEDVEISGFLTSTISWGNRKSIIKSAEKLIELLDHSPYDFILNHKKRDLDTLKPFVHRTFNGIDLIQFVKSLKHIYRNYNGLEEIFRNNINTGFSGGNMDGYNKSSGEYLLFINNDCQCLNDVLQPLIKFMEDNERAGLLTGKVRGLDGKYTGTHKLFPCLSRSLLGNAFVRWISKTKFISPKERISKPTKAQVVTGAFMFFRRKIFEKIDGFDTQFFLDCEEEDISKRVWDYGKEVYVLPEPEIIHEHGGSKKENVIGLRNEFYISYKKLMFKHYNKPYSLIMLLLTSLKIFKYFIFI